MKCYNGTRISESNKKMGEVGSFSTLPIVTCNKNAPCFKDCYAQRMCRYRESVHDAWEINTEMVEDERWADIFADVTEYVRFRHSAMFRWFVGGDIWKAGMLDTMVRVAEECPQCEFLAFTKCYDIVKAYRGDIPKNLHIVLSAWNDFAPDAELIDRFPVCYYDDGSRKLPEHAKVCLGGCESCQLCWTMKAGEAVRIVKH